MKETFTAALQGARTLAHIDEMAKGLWQAHGAGVMTDADAEGLAALVEIRRREIRPKDCTAVRAPFVARLAANCYPQRRRPVSPDRAASLTRRRRLATSGVMPPALACRYTFGQLAVLRIVADEFRDRGACVLSIGAIAARAGVGMTTARDAIRAAALDGVLVIQERRRRGAPSLTNIVKIISAEWRVWIDRGRRIASKFSGPTKTQDIKGDRAARAQHHFDGQRRVKKIYPAREKGG